MTEQPAFDLVVVQRGTEVFVLTMPQPEGVPDIPIGARTAIRFDNGDIFVGLQLVMAVDWRERLKKLPPDFVNLVTVPGFDAPFISLSFLKKIYKDSPLEVQETCERISFNVEKHWSEWLQEQRGKLN